MPIITMMICSGRPNKVDGPHKAKAIAEVDIDITNYSLRGTLPNTDGKIIAASMYGKESITK